VPQKDGLVEASDAITEQKVHNEGNYQRSERQTAEEPVKKCVDNTGLAGCVNDLAEEGKQGPPKKNSLKNGSAARRKGCHMEEIQWLSSGGSTS